MEKNNNVNLAAMNEIFNNKTFEYRINGFARACNMHNIEVLRNSGVLFNTKKKNDDIKYYIVASTGGKSEKGYGVTLSGYYGDLSFTFTNYRNLNKDIIRIDRKILELPFSISLFKNIDKDIYHLEIETINGMETKFTITKSRDLKNKILSSKVSFYANVLDFSKILKLVKSFVYNPILVFNTYNEVINSKKITITNSDLNKAILQDENLDKPVSKIKKKIKNIIGNN